MLGFLKVFCRLLVLFLFPLTCAATELPCFDAPVWIKGPSTTNLTQIAFLAHKVQRRHISLELETVRFHKVSGAFYKLPGTRTVLYCPSFSKKNMIGKGVYKRVYKGYLYSGSNVERVAVGVGTSNSILDEAELMRKIPFPEYLQSFRAAFKLHHKKVIVLKYYNMGSARQLFDDEVRFRQKEKARIALDVLLALKAIHAAHMAHCDLHDGNILIHRKSDGTVRATIVDFGRTLYEWEKKDKRPQGPRFRNPPETIFRSFDSINLVHSDLYAFGCFLYKLFMGEQYQGSFLYDCKKAPFFRKSKKRRLYSRVLRLYGHEVSHFCSELNHAPLNRQDLYQLKRDILLLLQPESKRRECLDVIEQDVSRLL